MLSRKDEHQFIIDSPEFWWTVVYCRSLHFGVIYEFHCALTRELCAHGNRVKIWNSQKESGFPCSFNWELVIQNGHCSRPVFYLRRKKDPGFASGFRDFLQGTSCHVVDLPNFERQTSAWRRSQIRCKLILSCVNPKFLNFIIYHHTLQRYFFVLCVAKICKPTKFCWRKHFFYPVPNKIKWSFLNATRNSWIIIWRNRKQTEWTICNEQALVLILDCKSTASNSCPGIKIFVLLASCLIPDSKIINKFPFKNSKIFLELKFWVFGVHIFKTRTKETKSFLRI